jgi:hypothetical protein
MLNQQALDQLTGRDLGNQMLLAALIKAVASQTANPIEFVEQLRDVALTAVNGLNLVGPNAAGVRALAAECVNQTIDANLPPMGR